MPSPIVQIRIPQELLDQAKAQAEADRRSFSAWVRLLIEDRLNGAGLPDQDVEAQEDQRARIARIKANPRVQERAAEIRERRKANQASVSQLEEHRSPKPGDERSNRSRRAGKDRGSGKRTAGSQAVGSGDSADQAIAQPAGPSLKRGKGGVAKSAQRYPSWGCDHPANKTTRKLGRPFCTDCGEFV